MNGNTDTGMNQAAVPLPGIEFESPVAGMKTSFRLVEFNRDAFDREIIPVKGIQVMQGSNTVMLSKVHLNLMAGLSGDWL